MDIRPPHPILWNPNQRGNWSSRYTTRLTVLDLLSCVRSNPPFLPYFILFPCPPKNDQTEVELAKLLCEAPRAFTPLTEWTDRPAPRTRPGLFFRRWCGGRPKVGGWQHNTRWETRFLRSFSSWRAMDPENVNGCRVPFLVDLLLEP